MKLTGPLTILFIGALVIAVALLSGTGPTDHNIGRSIGTTVAKQIGLLLGGALVLSGATWLLVRWLNRPSDNANQDP